MMITAEILSIPPYLSTSWKNISSLHALPVNDKFTLIAALNNGINVTIQSLDKPIIDAIFEGHARYGTSTPQIARSESAIPPQPGNIDLMNSTTQHNADLANSPDIPQEVLKKFTAIAKVLGLNEMQELPKAEPHCNCPYCQVARAFQSSQAETKVEEPISEKDLQFRTWDIKQTGEKLFSVINPLDEKEQYSVFLGDPLGCTCGLKNCEHIRAVLNS
jgi:hypothetical protein